MGEIFSVRDERDFECFTETFCAWIKGLVCYNDIKKGPNLDFFF